MKIEHVALYVKDLERVRSFYETWFQAKAGEKYVNPTKNFQSYFLSFENGCRLELMHQPQVPENQNDVEKQSLGLIHFAVSVGSVEKVDEMTAQLRLAGHPILGEPRWTGDGYYESVILDPEGNRIEITV
ncbi:MAG: VOC family protein [Lewinellaceae bacterium]|nr:VOC family protein [Lewinellaceae bacterium]